jgi:hypothetical protein
MSPTDTYDAADDIGDDRIRGVKKIAEFLNEPARRIGYLIEIGALPVGREGAAIVASKARLRAYHRRITGVSADT